MKKFIISFIFITLVNHSFSQQFEEELKAAIKIKPKFEFRLDSRNSFISSSGVRIFGVKIGAQFDNRLSVGIGYNRLSSEIKNKNIEWYGLVLNGNLSYNYISPYIEYVFYQDEKWEISIPVQFGIGNSFYDNTSNLGPNKLSFKTVLSYEPAITFQYKFLEYFGAGMGVGYRLMIIPNKEIEERFTSPVYLFKFKVYFQDLIYDLKEK
jgi:hypothetical protein